MTTDDCVGVRELLTGDSSKAEPCASTECVHVQLNKCARNDCDITMLDERLKNVDEGVVYTSSEKNLVAQE